MIRFLATALLISAPAFAQVDFSGSWAPLYHEDLPDRIPGPELGDYTGLPINDAARLRADSYDADRISVVTEYRMPAALRPTIRCAAWPTCASMSIRDPVTQRMVAFHTRMGFQEMERTIWLDGRPHPSEYAPHTWQGFSTGTWEDNMLNIYTTHLKESYLKRNGLPRSDKATFTEHWVRHGNYLTVATVITDPVFLTEPLVRTQTWVLDPAQVIAPDICETVAGSAQGGRLRAQSSCRERIHSCTRSRTGTACPTRRRAAARKRCIPSTGRRWASPEASRQNAANATAPAARKAWFA